MFFFFNDTATTEIYTLSYTTLFRSVIAFVQPTSGEVVWYLSAGLSKPFFAALLAAFAQETGAGRERHIVLRSEEHTSELQSRQYLVCRLLLEKTNKALSALPSSIIP